MFKNPFGAGFIRDENGMEMDDFYFLYKCAMFSDNMWTHRITRGSYRKKIELICTDADKCVKITYNWNRFRRYVTNLMREAHKEHNENRVATRLRSVYMLIMTLKNNIEECSIDSVNKKVCDEMLQGIDRSRIALLKCMSYCRVAVPKDE